MRVFYTLLDDEDQPGHAAEPKKMLCETCGAEIDRNGDPVVQKDCTAENALRQFLVILRNDPKAAFAAGMSRLGMSPSEIGAELSRFLGCACDRNTVQELLHRALAASRVLPSGIRGLEKIDRMRVYR